MGPDRDKKSLHARVHGMVQGVGFRYSTITRARRLGLTGFVRNAPDATVEVLAEGAKNDLDELLGWLRSGPPAARVGRVDHRFGEHSGRYAGFSVEY